MKNSIDIAEIEQNAEIIKDKMFRAGQLRLQGNMHAYQKMIEDINHDYFARNNRWLKIVATNQLAGKKLAKSINNYVEEQPNASFNLSKPVRLSDQLSDGFTREELSDDAKKIAKNLNQIGQVYLKKEHWEHAESYFRKACQLNPESAWYCQNLAESVAMQKRWDESVRLCRHALKLNPKEVEKYNQSLSIAPDRKGKFFVPNPIFIVGCGHSGTSILQAIIGNNPDVYPVPEESALFTYSDTKKREIMHAWDVCTQQQHKILWLEKTPPHIFQIAKFLKHRPQSRFIVILRDGRDVVCSMKNRKGYANLTDRIERWVYDNLAAIPYWKHPQVHVLKYEELILHPEKTISDICLFLEIKYAKEMLDYHHVERCWYSDEISKPNKIITHQDHNDLRNWQINQPLFDGREKWKKEMSAEDKEAFKQSLGQKYLEKFAYVTDETW